VNQLWNRNNGKRRQAAGTKHGQLLQVEQGLIRGNRVELVGQIKLNWALSSTTE